VAVVSNFSQLHKTSVFIALFEVLCKIFGSEGRPDFIELLYGGSKNISLKNVNLELLRLSQTGPIHV
jgi:hypothetical protein